MRRTFPESYADLIGIETVGRTGLPEKLWEGGLPGVWLLRETARIFGYDWGVTSCFEANYRQERLLGPQRQAEWYVRDVMLSHAYRLPYISIALLHDTGNDYHASFWGATGLCRRYPLLYPKKAYVAMATATRVLDRVTLLREVRDRERGRCLELELKPRHEQLPTPLLSEYAVLRLKKPVTLPGEPTTLGLWVKGNSGWGQVYWESTDAAGVRRISCGTTEHDADVFDYDGRVAINFDGWAFLHLPVTEASPIPDLSTGRVANLWESSDRATPVTYPITLTGIAVSLPRQALHLTEMIPLKQVLRFRDLSAYE